LHPNSYYARYLFVPLEKTTGRFWGEMAAAIAGAALTTRLGISWGDWMRKIQR
jgi:hypothetical protein